MHWTDPEVIRSYVAGYFVHPDPQVWEPLADVLVRVTLSPDYPRWARAAALTFQMIYQQPVRYEYQQIAPPTLLIVGADDHVVPLGQYATPEEAARLGDFVELSAAAAHDIPQATQVVVPECGHIPHLEVPDQFLVRLAPFPSFSGELIRKDGDRCRQNPRRHEATKTPPEIGKDCTFAGNKRPEKGLSSFSTTPSREHPVEPTHGLKQTAGYDNQSESALSGSTRRSWVREVMPNLLKTLRRWYATVCWLMNRRSPISVFERPSRASRAIWVS